MERYELIEANEERIRELKEGSAFTFEGFKADEENLTKMVSVLTEETLLKLCPTIYTWKGKIFNDMYHLTGDNRYPDDLTFISLPLDNWDSKNIATLSIFKIKIGARWLDDIVDNNAMREGYFEDDDCEDEEDY